MSSGIGSLLGGVAGTFFGGPVGGAIGAKLGGMIDDQMDKKVDQSMQNQVTQTTGDAATQAAQTLHKQDGMPKFLVDEITKAVQEVVSHHQHPDCDPVVDRQVSDQCKPGLEGIKDELVKIIVDAVRQAMQGQGSGGAGAEVKPAAGQKGAEKATQAPANESKDLEKINQQGLENNQKINAEKADGAGAAGKGRKPSANSWLQAMAQAMGGILGGKAQKMVELSNRLNDVSAKGTQMKEAAAAAAQAPQGQNGKSVAKPSEADQAENAHEFTQVQSELQAVSQELNMLQNSFTNVIKSIGEALGQMARKG